MFAADWLEDCSRRADPQLSLEGPQSGAGLSEEALLRAFLARLKAEKRLNIVGWTPPKRAYPAHMLLSGDKGILAYIDFTCFAAAERFSASGFSRDADALLETVRVADSQLDRPVFFVYLLCCGDLRGVYFETNEQVKDRFFRGAVAGRRYAPVPDELGDLENLLALWRDLKQNNVRV